MYARDGVRDVHRTIVLSAEISRMIVPGGVLTQGLMDFLTSSRTTGTGT